jgi:hypothetical protein
MTTYKLCLSRDASMKAPKNSSWYEVGFNLDGYESIEMCHNAATISKYIFDKYVSNYMIPSHDGKLLIKHSNVKLAKETINKSVSDGIRYSESLGGEITLEDGTIEIITMTRVQRMIDESFLNNM